MNLHHLPAAVAAARRATNLALLKLAQDDLLQGTSPTKEAWAMPGPIDEIRVTGFVLGADSKIRRVRIDMWTDASNGAVVSARCIEEVMS